MFGQEIIEATKGKKVSDLKLEVIVNGEVDKDDVIIKKDGIVYAMKFDTGSDRMDDTTYHETTVELLDEENNVLAEINMFLLEGAYGQLMCNDVEVYNLYHPSE